MKLSTFFDNTENPLVLLEKINDAMESFDFSNVAVQSNGKIRQAFVTKDGLEFVAHIDYFTSEVKSLYPVFDKWTQNPLEKVRFAGDEK